ncbi:YcnI family protein [Saccharopolyspora indica]|uniref:YcnI family copper-binding membrane protein n=1 Tax=Saccharopolyspora indica TaxID=1229659 RepID=UPI0022EB917F|nr:YcnI family protein [Saccharopolyspora indica]MDA3644525.1 YcnI family protein [Saccharopolyspora indica]
MSTKRFAVRSAALTAACGITALLGAAPAFAHVSAQPGEAAKGGHAKVAFRVPNERPNASTVQIKVTFPEDQPLSSVRTKPMPGWTAQVERVQIAPVQVAGSEVREAVRSITWTAQPGNRIGPNEFNEFEATLGALPDNVDSFAMPTTQTYDNGEVVNWDQPTPPNGEEPEHPAPTLKLVEDAEGGHSHGGAEEQPAAAGAGDDTARWLGGAGLLVGALGVGIGAGALARSRNAAPTGKDES